MKFKQDIPSYEQLGNTRTKRIFLLTPTKINGETRWLEFINVQEQVVLVSESGFSYEVPRWVPQRYITVNENKSSYSQKRPMATRR